MILQKAKNKNAYVIFTREPVPGNTKTRLMPYYTAEQCAELHRCFLRDIACEMRWHNFDIIVAYTGGDPVFLKSVFGNGARYIGQRGDGLGERMENAFSDVLKMGYGKVVLTGSDIPELEADTIDTAFAMLEAYDAVIGPTADGGYYLLGMKELHQEAFDVKKYGLKTVFEETVSSIGNAGLTVGSVDEYNDIDTREDMTEFRRRFADDARLRRSHSARFVTDNLKISVVIPVFNEEKTIGAMVSQLKKYVHPKDDVEIVFVDGGSTDNTLSVLGSDFKVLRSDKGRGRQLNMGASCSSGDVLFFLHCDSVLPGDFVYEIKRCMMKHSFGCFGVKFESRNAFMLSNRLISNHRALVRGIPFGDQGMFIDRELFFETGMFPEIPFMEDYAYSLKLRRYGIKPGMTRKRIVSSARRYGNGTRSILLTEYRMWNLRRLYRNGKKPEELVSMYGDVR